MVTADWGDIYRELGATPVINATGSVTMLGGSTPIPEVKEAMRGPTEPISRSWNCRKGPERPLPRWSTYPQPTSPPALGSALMLATAAGHGWR